MTITYVVDAGLGAVLSCWTGEVTIAELRAHWAQVLDDPAARALACTVADLSQARLAFHGDDLHRAVHEVAAPRLRGLTWANAIVVAQPVQYGVSRQFQVFSELISDNAIFPTMAAALAWVRRR